MNPAPTWVSTCRTCGRLRISASAATIAASIAGRLALSGPRTRTSNSPSSTSAGM
jgi:hypothetical protein